MAFARLCAHYFFSHAAWPEDGQLLRDAGRMLEALNRFARR
jgi:hypothetical protein